MGLLWVEMDGWVGWSGGGCFGGLETVKARSLGAKPGWEKPERAEEQIAEERRRAKKAEEESFEGVAGKRVKCLTLEKCS